MDKNRFLKKETMVRCAIVLVSLFMNGLGIGIMRLTCLGTDPFNSMNYGFSEYFQIPMSMVFLLISAILLIFIFLSEKNMVGFGTLASMTVLGTAADFWIWVIKEVFSFQIEFSGTEYLGLRIFSMIVGIIGMVFFTSFYISADLGMAPYDALGFVIEKKVQKISFLWIRILLDLCCVIIAYITAGKCGKQWELIGIGTIIMAFGTGPLLTFFKEKIAEPLLKKYVEVM